MSRIINFWFVECLLFATPDVIMTTLDLLDPLAAAWRSALSQSTKNGRWRLNVPNTLHDYAGLVTVETIDFDAKHIIARSSNLNDRDRSALGASVHDLGGGLLLRPPARASIRN
jgi:hypothetical protein